MGSNNPLLPFSPPVHLGHTLDILYLCIIYVYKFSIRIIILTTFTTFVICIYLFNTFSLLVLLNTLICIYLLIILLLTYVVVSPIYLILLYVFIYE